MSPLAMLFDSISIKECIGAEWTQQLHAQMGVVHMRMEGSVGG